MGYEEIIWIKNPKDLKRENGLMNKDGDGVLAGSAMVFLG